MKVIKVSSSFCNNESTVNSVASVIRWFYYVIFLSLASSFR